MRLSIPVGSIIKEKPTKLTSSAGFDRRISLWLPASAALSKKLPRDASDRHLTFWRLLNF